MGEAGRSRIYLLQPGQCRAVHRAAIRQLSRADEVRARDIESIVNTAERLRAMADNMDEKAQEVLTADRKVNTCRRADMAAGTIASALRSIQFAETLRNIADGFDAGQVRFIDGIRARTHIEELESLARRAHWDSDRAAGVRYEESENRPIVETDTLAATYPWPYAHRSALREMAADFGKRKGFVRDAERMGKLAREAKDEMVTLTDPRDIESMGAIVAEEPNHFRYGMAKDSLNRYQRFQRMGLTDINTLRAALREYIRYRGTRRQESPIARMERDLVGTQIPGYFPTPRDIVERMVTLADIRPGNTILEPSAGKGSIADVISEQYPEIPWT